MKVCRSKFGISEFGKFTALAMEEVLEHLVKFLMFPEKVKRIWF